MCNGRETTSSARSVHGPRGVQLERGEVDRLPATEKEKAVSVEGLGRGRTHGHSHPRASTGSDAVAQRLNEIVRHSCDWVSASGEEQEKGGSESEQPEEEEGPKVKGLYCDSEQVLPVAGTDHKWNSGRLISNRHQVGDCDCAVCLGEELGRVQREILLMIGAERRAQQPPTPAVDVGGRKWGHVYVRRDQRNGGLGQQKEEEEEEFPDASACDDDLESLVMVTGGGGFPEMAASATVEKNATTVEGQLSALLTSTSKDVLTDGSTKRHTNLIENQLLTLEDQFWRNSNTRSQGTRARDVVVQHQPTAQKGSHSLGSTVQAVVLEADEDTALLADPSQQATMSESTPVKRAVKVLTVGSGTTSVVLEEDPGGGVPRMGLVASPSANLGRMKRFEQFLKSLVGKKSSSATTHADGMAKDVQQDTAAGTTGFERPALKVRSTVELKSAGSNRVLANDSLGDPVDLSPLHRHSFGSMSSLNSAVQQKFLNILPTSSSLSATKRNMSVNNLSTIPERRPGGTQSGQHARMATPCCRNGGTERKVSRGLKTVSCSFSNFEHLNDVSVGARQLVPMGERCEGGEASDRDGRRDSLHSWRLKVSKSTNHLQSMMTANGGPVRPLNRFRNSLLESVSQVNLVQEAQCSRCSSILSLAAGTMVKVRCSDSSVESSEVAARAHEVDGGVATGQDVKIVIASAQPENTVQSCKLCLGEVAPQQLTGISQCRCTFCTDVSKMLFK